MATAVLKRSGQTQSIALRFLWKDCRRLRGFAFGAGLLGLLVMLVFRAIDTATPLSGFTVLVAAGTTVFFALGACITLFAVESEEGTREWLQLIPNSWSAMLLGKLAAVIVSTLAMAAVLLLLARLVGGGWPLPREGAPLFAGQLTLFVVEAIVWGLFCSLLCPWPLVAAVLACALTSAHSQIAIAMGVESSGYSPADYLQASSTRLLLAGLVFVVDILLTRRWMQIRSTNARPVRPGWFHTSYQELESSGTSSHAAALSLRRSIHPQNWIAIGRRFPFRGFLRLRWQSVRESWAAMLMVMVGGVLLTGAAALLVTTFAGRIQSSNLYSLDSFSPYPAIACLLFIPALFGAHTFTSDQRHSQYTFLARHAAPPRLIWLARVVTWATPMLLLAVTFAAIGAAWIWFTTQSATLSSIAFLNSNNWAWSYTYGLTQQLHIRDAFYYVVLCGALGMLAAYALGQLVSLLIRSQVLAAGTALLASAVVVHWCGLIALWRLSPVWCLLPVIVAPLLATYLRTRDWLVDRHRIGRWIAVACALFLPIGLMLLCVPTYRQLQIEQAKEQLTNIWQGRGRSLQAAVKEREKRLQDAEATTQEYRQLLLEFNLNAARQFDLGGDADSFKLGEISHLLTNFHLARIAADIDPTLLASLIELTRQPAIELTITFDIAGKPVSADRSWVTQVATLLIGNMELALEEGDLDLALECYIAYYRYLGQIWQSDSLSFPVTYLVDQCESTTDAERVLLQWALAPDQTPERIKLAIKQLGEADQNYPLPGQAIIAERERIATVLRGDEPPTHVGESGKQDWARMETAALLLHQLPGEQQTALIANDAHAIDAFGYVNAMILGMTPIDRRTALGARYRDDRDNLYVFDRDGRLAVPAIQRYRARQRVESSLLTAREWPENWKLTDFCRKTLYARTARNLSRWRLALIAHHLEHGKYPETLREILPDFYPALYADHFSDTGMFSYKPNGFELPAFGRNFGVDSRSWEYKEFPPGTPLIWTVGAGNVYPFEGTRFNPIFKHEPDENVPAEDIEQTGVHGIFFDATEGPFAEFLALPLPKKEDYPNRSLD